MKKKRLLLTSLNLPFKENEILLGEWCKNFSDKDVKKNNFNTMPYHWDNRSKLRDNYEYLETLHNNLLDSLVISLNNIHKTSHSKRYWQIILDPWIMDYLSILYDRWETIRAASEYSNDLFIEKFEFDPNIYFPLETMDNLHGFFNQDEANQMLYQDIIEFNFSDNIHQSKIDKKVNLKLNENYPNQIKHKTPHIFTVLKNNFKSIIYNLVDKVLAKISSNDFIFIDSYFKKIPLIKINILLNQFPRIYYKDFNFTNNQINLIKKNSNYKKRENFRIEFKAETSFEFFLLSYIKNHLPIHIIEGYISTVNEIKKIKVKGKVILSANSHWSDYIKKFWIAEQVALGSKFITLAHGGSFPPTKEDFNFEEDISDFRAIWLKEYHPKHIQLPPSKLVHLDKEASKDTKKNKYKNCVMVMYNGRKWSFRANFYPQSYQGVKLVNDSAIFYKNLNNDIKSNLKVRFHHNLGLDEEIRFSKLIDKKITSSKGDYDKFINNSKFIICTYPETTFTEAMASNVPTVMFYDKNLFERKSKFDHLINELVEAKIIFFDPLDASNHINEIWKDIDSWWGSKKVYRARLKFRKNAMHIDTYWTIKWLNFLLKFKNKSNKLDLKKYIYLSYKNLRLFFHIFIYNPSQVINEFISDVNKDLIAKKYSSTKYKVWCAGLPHSGSTLIEEIFENLPYVGLNSSLIRFFYNRRITHLHGISHDAFLSFPEKKYSFLKTHSHYEPESLDFANLSNVTTIVCLRDLRDMMLSRYWHIIANKKHQSHKLVSKMPFKEGLITSMLEENQNNYYASIPIDDYFQWIKNWLDQEKKGTVKIFWFEDYISDPVKYLDKLKLYLEFNELDSKVIEKILVNKRGKHSKQSLSQRLLKKGRNKSTFRSGQVGGWKKYFDNDIISAIESNISGDLKEALRDESK